MDSKEQEMKQDRRLKPAIQGENNNNQLQAQKCPRCESINTKFCYYNNYSLSQPRYFCKTCRRYWTQGGTLRNVPVGGGCRKGKRLKTSGAASPSSSENFRSQSQSQNMKLGANSAANTELLVAGLSSTKESDHTDLNTCASVGSFYPAGGFLSSLAAIQSLSNNSIAQQQQLPVAGITTSDLDLLNGTFSAAATAPFGSNQQTQFHPSSNQNWHHFSTTGTKLTVPDTALWSTSTSTTAANNNSNINTAILVSASASHVSFPLNPNDNHWHDFSGYGNPPT